MRSLFSLRSILKTLPMVALAIGFLPLAGEGTEENETTVITSVRMEMQGTAEKNYFYFSEDVLVSGTNLVIRCNELTVVALREGAEAATIGEIGAIEQIVARGSVEIHQAGRSAYAGLAEVNPKAGTVTLSDSPRIIDNEVEVEGYQFVLHKGEKKFVSVPDPNAPPGQPSRSVVRLGALPDLGFDQPEETLSLDPSMPPESDLEEQSMESESGEDPLPEGGGDGGT